MSKVFWIVFTLLSAAIYGESRHSKEYKKWTPLAVLGCIVGVLMLVYELGGELPPI